MKENKLGLPTDFFKQFKSKEQFQEFFQELFKEGVQHMLQGELDEHLGYEKHDPEGRNSGNSRNGHSSKKVKSETVGDLVLSIPRDRNSTFEPKLIPKHKRMSEQIEQSIIGMYSRGMSTRDIEDQVREMYGVEVSESTVSTVTSRVLDHIVEWQSRPLDPVYFTCWMDGIQFRIRHNGKVINKCIYLVIGLNSEGRKEVLGMWINETESASFWLSVMTDLKVRGVQDILIACTDNLTGFTKAIREVFPQTVTQLCVVHQIRNSCKYVAWKERKEFVADLKPVYRAVNREAAWHALEAFSAKWGKKYGYAITSWQNNWEALTQYFDYPVEIRTLIYTTNVIESLNSGIRKYTKAKTLFPDDQAALKAVYLSVMNIQKKWTQSIPNWGTVLNQFIIIFENRCQL
ncbi:MAG: IS256 family transposase [Sphingobacteriaceae bacterium]|nr:MAG: IS256 family transposase [Sphingobacteriaceae bacterium]